MIQAYQTAADVLHGLAPYAVLAARLVVGVMFALSGWCKLTNAEQHAKMRRSLQEAGIPAPEVQGWFVSACELLFGGLLVLGLATLLSAGVLAIICLVALFTVTGKEIEGVSPLMRLSSLLYTPEVLLLALLAWLIAAGPGALSLDGALGLS
ncbi:hypothetical protein BH10PSE4_BH10PSE4_37440 [soil metagenome]